MIRNIINTKQLLFLLLILFAVSVHSNGQPEQAKYVGYLNEIKEVFNYKNLSYKYRVALYNDVSKKEVDNAQGVLLKQGKSYLDSNTLSLTLSNGGYLLNASFNDRTANIYRVSSMEKNLGIKQNGIDIPMMSIADTMLLKVGTFYPEEGVAGQLSFKYVLHDKGAMLKEIHFRIRQADMNLLGIEMILKDRGNYSKIFRMYDFNNLFDLNRMDIGRYFKVSGNKVEMSKPFQAFKVNALL